MKKVIRSTHKGHEVMLCTGCSAVVENKASTKYFPEGYHYDNCPKCGFELDYKNEVVITPTVFKASDFVILERMVEERKAAIAKAKELAEAK
jgi:hypothetical protein